HKIITTDDNGILVSVNIDDNFAGKMNSERENLNPIINSSPKTILVDGKPVLINEKNIEAIFNNKLVENKPELFKINDQNVLLNKNSDNNIQVIPLDTKGNFARTLNVPVTASVNNENFIIIPGS